MHKLNDPKLLAQCERIKKMIAQVAQDPKHQNDYYARTYHHWKVSPPAELSEIEAFEADAGVTLPEEYVYYLTQVGRGGACPGTIFDDFDPEWGKKEDRLKFASESLCEIMGEDEWEELFGEGDFPEDGIMYLCAMDITYLAYLIVSGPLAGHVVYLDYNHDTPPMWPKGCPDFLTWCEAFYRELLAGHDINPTWKFMWMQPGYTADIIAAFYEETNTAYKKEILQSFFKFQILPKEGYQFLKSVKDPDFIETAESILAYFKQK